MKLFSKLSFLALFVVSAGAYAGEQCRESSEAAGPVAPWGRASTQRNRRMAQHAQLDL